MESPMRDQSISHLRQLIMSTSRKKNSASLSVKEKNRTTGFSFELFSQKLAEFCRMYFSGTKIPDDLLREIATEENLANLLLILCNALFIKYPLRQSYCRTVLKSLISQLERNSIEVPDEIYSSLAEAMCGGHEYSYRLYLNNNGSSVLCIVSESNQQLCHGTTGLSIWQASCDMAYLCSTFLDFTGKVVLELGAGCGLAGISVACTSNANVVLSDYDPKVLERLRLNVDLMSKDGESPSVYVQNIDWTSFDISCLERLPDVILAADVVYDRLLLPHLCSVISLLLKANANVEAIIASTLRDPETLKVFRECLGDAGLAIVDKVSYQNNTFHFDDRSIHSPTSFPFFSALDSPTIFYQVKLSK